MAKGETQVVPTLPIPQDCDFCGLADNPAFPYDVTEPIDYSGDVIIKPTRGMQVAGYFLAITTEHVTSFAQLSEGQLRATDTALARYEDFFGGDYFRVEHGSDNITTCGSGGCIDHAHIHLIPADERVGPQLQRQLPWERLSSYEDLTRFRLGGEAVHFAVANPQLPGQWVRRQVAQALEDEDWDWATYNDVWQVSQTFFQAGWGPSWKDWAHSRWHYDPDTCEWVVRNRSNQPNFNVTRELRAWSLGVPGTPGSHVDLERTKQARHTGRKEWMLPMTTT